MTLFGVCLALDVHLFLCHIQTLPQAMMLRPMETEVSCRESIGEQVGLSEGDLTRAILSLQAFSESLTPALLSDP